MASLGKLCLIVSEEPESRPCDVQRKVETCLALGEQHAALPRDIRLHHGLDGEDMRVLQPEDLVQVSSNSKGNGTLYPSMCFSRRFYSSLTRRPP